MMGTGTGRELQDLRRHARLLLHRPISEHRPDAQKTIVRLLAAFHSCLLMCVAASHNAMQSCNVAPPPWAVIDADSLWVIETLGELSLSADAPPWKEIAAMVVAIATNQRR
jgi:hypothetical protein